MVDNNRARLGAFRARLVLCSGCALIIAGRCVASVIGGGRWVDLVWIGRRCRCGSIGAAGCSVPAPCQWIGRGGVGSVLVASVVWVLLAAFRARLCCRSCSVSVWVLLAAPLPLGVVWVRGCSVPGALPSLQGVVWPLLDVGWLLRSCSVSVDWPWWCVGCSVAAVCWLCGCARLTVCVGRILQHLTR
ncbi:MAG: hypothetical protein IKO75_04110, partial [Bacteroidales bacterium]|nr:hypothetical protein [Bacteroidales bacterium]